MDSELMDHLADNYGDLPEPERSRRTEQYLRRSAAAKPTPGPWALDSNGPGHEVIFAHGGRHAVAAVQGTDDPAENLANGHLMTAAPDLSARIDQALQMRGYTLATARSISEEAEHVYRSAGAGGLRNWARQIREAAIAKAEGR